MKILITPFLFFVLFVVSAAHAVSISDKTFLGSNTSGTTLNGDGDFGAEPSDPTKDIWSWNLGLFSTSSTMVDPNTNTNIIDKTTGVNAGISWLMPTELEATFGVSYAGTPDENLIDSGANIGANYTFNLKNSPPKKAKEDAQDEPGDDFVPSIFLKTNISYLKYSQSTVTTTSARRSRAVRAVATTNAIEQTAYTLEGGISPIEWASLSYTYIKYNYSRDINSFLQYLDSPGLRTKSTGLSTAVSGFPTDLKETNLTIYPLPYWSLELIYAMTVQASDNSFMNSSEGTIYRTLGNWRLGAGYKQEYSLATFDQIYSVYARIRL